MKKIIPAILTNNVKELKEKLSQVENLSDWVQIDFADNDFVANQTIKVLDLAEIKTNLNLEAHLMVNNPADWFNDCAKVGFKRVIFHIEAKEDLEYTLHAASLYDFEIGIALNPDSKVELIAPVIDKINSVLLMGVNPGFSGQKFIPEVLNKVSDIRKISDGVIIAVDGGMNYDTLGLAAKAGVDNLMVSSALFIDADIDENYERLLKRVEG